VQLSKDPGSIKARMGSRWCDVVEIMVAVLWPHDAARIRRVAWLVVWSLIFQRSGLSTACDLVHIKRGIVSGRTWEALPLGGAVVARWKERGLGDEEVAP
jgi:hypothetical protein